MTLEQRARRIEELKRQVALAEDLIVLTARLERELVGENHRAMAAVAKERFNELAESLRLSIVLAEQIQTGHRQAQSEDPR